MLRVAIRGDRKADLSSLSPLNRGEGSRTGASERTIIRRLPAPERQRARRPRERGQRQRDRHPAPEPQQQVPRHYARARDAIDEWSASAGAKGRLVRPPQRYNRPPAAGAGAGAPLEIKRANQTRERSKDGQSGN